MTETLARRLVLVVLLGASALTLAACAACADRTWINPDTGSVPPRAARGGG